MIDIKPGAYCIHLVEHKGYCSQCGNELNSWQQTKRGGYCTSCDKCGQYNERDSLSEEKQTKIVDKYYFDFGNTEVDIRVTKRKEKFGVNVTPHRGKRLDI